MRINKLILNNFRQYYGSVEVDLRTNDHQNIILVGGKNGFGKTNFLLALVWCIYGDQIEQIDDNFKREIRKEKNFAQFIKHTLNWEAKAEGKSSFFVQIELSEINLPDFQDNTQTQSHTCILKREFHANTMKDTLSINIPTLDTHFLVTEDDKVDFINDYLVPIEAAKFVFFDAEKIANLAELSTKEEGNFMNDALGKLLGLDIYESLADDLTVYSTNLRREGANENIREQITNAESTIKINKHKIERIDEQIADLDNEVRVHKANLRKYSTYLNEHSKKAGRNHDRPEIMNRIDKLQKEEIVYEKKFNDLSEILPFTIAAGTLEEVFEHLNSQKKLVNSNHLLEEIREKFENIIDLLFERSPKRDKISSRMKAFYINEAEKVFDEVYEEEKEDSDELSFEHDLNNTDKNLIKEIYTLILQQSKDTIQQTIEGYNRTKNELQEAKIIIRQIDADLQDETILEYITKKEDIERNIFTLAKKQGALTNQQEKLKSDIIKLNRRLVGLSNKIEARDQLKQKLEKTNDYIKTLNTFIDKQKKSTEKNLGKNIFSELQKLMHKLKGGSKFIEEVKVHALPDNGGLKVTLYNSEDERVPKESLSQGEKQLYISSLIKAILKEAIQDFPIFIDTPLGRLDHEHINNILLHYYPDLAKQVVILATNNEIPQSRYELIKENVANAYLLVNKDNRTTIQKGYFKSYDKIQN